jgi:hypothetical protein
VIGGFIREENFLSLRLILFMTKHYAPPFTLSLLIAVSVLLASCSKGTENEKSVSISVEKTVPAKAKAGWNLKVTGSGFLSIKAKDSAGTLPVYFGYVVAAAAMVNDTLIELQVPAGAVTGQVCVEWQGKRYCSQQPFTILPGNTVSNTFMRLPAYPDNSSVAFMLAINNVVYVSAVNEFWSFNLETYQWTKEAQGPPERSAYRSVPAVLNGKGYVFGDLTANGGNGDKQLWEFDPQPKKWTVKKPLPAAARFNCVAFAANNRQYIAGGTNLSYGSTVPTELWEYNPATDQWSRKSDMLAGIAMETWVYRLQEKSYLNTSGGMLEYDPLTGNQRLLASGPATHFGAVHSSEKWNNIAYVINSGGSSQVTRLAMGGDNQTIFQETFKYPIEPGAKPIRNFASTDDELIFFSQDINSTQIDFWEYLPD